MILSVLLVVVSSVIIWINSSSDSADNGIGINGINGGNGIGVYTVDLTRLNVEPYKTLNKAIDANFDALCGALQGFDPNNHGTYTAFTQVGESLQPFRTVLTLSDGTVLYDSTKGKLNTHFNAKNKAINENHNNRIAIMSAQLNNIGKAWERKLSTSGDEIEDYVARRCGSQFDNFGTIRLSSISSQ
eukprot:392870_1